MGAAEGTFVIKRIYEKPADDDGCRVLVDRLWPRGVSKGAAALDHWLKDVAPTPGLRKEFGHMRERYGDFRGQYLAELDQNPAVEELLELGRTHARVTLLFAAHDPELNHARVLLEFIRGHTSR